MELTATCSRVVSHKVCVTDPTLAVYWCPIVNPVFFCDVPGLPMCDYQKRASTCAPGWSALGPPCLVTAPSTASWSWCWMQETWRHSPL
jgi:hypothetical protein